MGGRGKSKGEKMKTLVVYYSFSGITRRMAEAIARETGADLAEIHPKTPIETREDINRLIQARDPFDIQPLEKDPNDYDLIFLGTPIWAFNPAMPFKSFLKQASIKGKSVAPFCTCQLFCGIPLWNMGRAFRGNRILGKAGFKSKSTVEDAVAWAKGIVAKASTLG